MKIKQTLLKKNNDSIHFVAVFIDTFLITLIFFRWTVENYTICYAWRLHKNLGIA